MQRKAYKITQLISAYPPNKAKFSLLANELHNILPLEHTLNGIWEPISESCSTPLMGIDFKQALPFSIQSSVATLKNMAE